METRVTHQLGIRHPIVQAPMGGGPSTPALAAAVSNAGALGSLAGGYLGPDQLFEEIDATLSLTARPFAVNLFAGGHEASRPLDSERIRLLLAPIHAELGLPPPQHPAVPLDRFIEQVDVVLQQPPPVVSFTFGIPPRDTIERFRRLGVVIMGTATVPIEGQLWEASGADIVVAQGAEAGAHRGTFAAPFEDAMIPTEPLVEELASLLRVPVIASGGVMEGRDIASMLSRGAEGVQMGTAFLTCPESGASSAYKRALEQAVGDTTVITRAFSGRPARGLRNAFIELLADEEEAILPYPAQNALTRPIREAAARSGRPEYLSLWAGQGVARIRTMRAEDLVLALVAETERALTKEA